MDTAKLESLFKQIEDAVDAHPALQRPNPSYPYFRVSRHGFKVEIDAKRIGSRKKITGISGNGDTAEEAVQDLIDNLDIWAKVL